MDTPPASLLGIRIFELVALALFLFGVWYVWRSRSWVLRGGYIGSVLTILFDWTFNTRWFFNVAYSDQFIGLFTINGVKQPIALAFTYGFFFGIPTAFLARHRDWMDARLGKWGWVVVFVGMGLLQPLFEIPMVSWLHAWTYYQRPAFLLGGVIWSNIWFSGLLGVTCYGGLRLALRWAPAVPTTSRPATSASAAASTALAQVGSVETRVRQAVLGLSAVWVAFAACTLLQLLLWYAPVQPWITGPRPF